MRADQFDDITHDGPAVPGHFNEFTGVFYPARKAGDRYTGAPRGLDSLLRMKAARTHYLSEKAAPAYVPSYRRLSVDDCRKNYERERFFAMRRSFARWCADRRIADRCAEIERSVAELRNRIARIAA